jgi:hypothetical protein
MLAGQRIKEENLSGFTVGHQIVTIGGKVEMGDRTGVLFDDLGLSELGLCLVEPNTPVLASYGAQLVIWGEFDDGDCLSCLAMLCLCYWGKLLVDHQEISVTHADGDAGAIVVVGDRISPAFKSGISDLAPSSDIPDA